MARRAEAETSHGVRYHVADLADADTWWDGQPFDGAICELALMDIEHFDTALAAIARTLKPGGWFIASIVHPCFPGNGTGLSSWPPDRGYTAEGWWTSPDHNPAGVRVRLGAHHRTLATYLNTLTDLGLILERVVEPPAEVPTLMVIRCRNAGSR
jgi:SAM-dependent methyltransferase